MTISLKKIWACPRNAEDSKVLIIGLICTLAIFMSISAYEAISLAQADLTAQIDFVLQR